MTAKSLSTPEPAPTHNHLPAVWDLVIKDMQDRHAEGCRKYGTPLQPFNGRDALVDAYQEALDLAVYLRQRIEESRLQQNLVSQPEPSDLSARAESRSTDTQNARHYGCYDRELHPSASAIFTVRCNYDRRDSDPKCDGCRYQKVAGTPAGASLSHPPYEPVGTLEK